MNDGSFISISAIRGYRARSTTELICKLLEQEARVGAAETEAV